MWRAHLFLFLLACGVGVSWSGTDSLAQTVNQPADSAQNPQQNSTNSETLFPLKIEPGSHIGTWLVKFLASEPLKNHSIVGIHLEDLEFETPLGWLKESSPKSAKVTLFVLDKAQDSNEKSNLESPKVPGKILKFSLTPEGFRQVPLNDSESKSHQVQIAVPLPPESWSSDKLGAALELFVPFFNEFPQLKCKSEDKGLLEVIESTREKKSFQLVSIKLWHSVSFADGKSFHDIQGRFLWRSLDLQNEKNQFFWCHDHEGQGWDCHRLSRPGAFEPRLASQSEIQDNKSEVKK